ncbi:MAG: sulfatase-like hydrolase/transferase [Candidatus Pacebacteria bacterium]|nr:sulfatase-like hydrolase/transferase [Candidatus Paceibacterota bacterium]
MIKKIKNQKKLFIALLFIVAFIVTSIFIHFSNQPMCKNCHVLVFDADIFRADFLDCKLHPELTPNLCEIEDEFIRFNNHHSHTDLTKPSMASFLTSSYPSTHGVWNEFFFLNKDQPNIINILKDNGYSTLINDYENPQVISDIYDKKINITTLKINNLIKDNPTFLYLYNASLHYPYLSEKLNNVIIHPNKPDKFPNNTAEFNQNAEKIINKEYPEIYQEPAIKDFITNQNGSLEGLYEYYSYLCWDAEIEVRLTNINSCWGIIEKTFEQYIDDTNPDHIEFIKYLYTEKVTELDEGIGNLIKYLKSEKLWDKTVFVIRSDHGEEFNEHGNLSHWNNLYQELIDVPLWIHIPKQEGREVNKLSQTIDETTTLLHILGIKPHPLMQGKNLLDKDSTAISSDYAIYQKAFNLTFSIREGDHKLISIDEPDSTNIDYELYNLKDDPQERKNIVNDFPEIKKRLFEKYYNIINELPQFKPFNEASDKLTKEQERNLYENGYF